MQIGVYSCVTVFSHSLCLEVPEQACSWCTGRLQYSHEAVSLVPFYHVHPQISPAAAMEGVTWCVCVCERERECVE